MRAMELLKEKLPGCPNFRWYEFISHTPSEIQQFLIANLGGMLQQGRFLFDMPFVVTSGVRDRWGNFQLKQQGYVVAKNTDHAYLDPYVYRFGVGAVDFTLGKDADPYFLGKVFRWYVAEGKANRMDFGQVIWYPPHRQAYRSMNSIHLSNPRSLWFSEGAIRLLPPKRKYLVYDPESGKFKVWHEDV